MFSKKKIFVKYRLTRYQLLKIEKFIDKIKEYNKHTNIVGKSTLLDPWRSHVLDSLQISDLIPKRNSSILDMGTGAGIPGLILAMNNYSKVSLVDSNKKKINFVRSVCSNLKVKANIYHSRIELIKNKKFDFLISRALANLNKLFFYSQNFLSKDTVLIFLKGKTVNDELKDAKLNWKFQYKLKQSESDKRGNILVVWGLNSCND